MVKTLKPGWQTERNYNFTALLTGIAVEEDLVNDQWTSLFKHMGLLGQEHSELSSEEITYTQRLLISKMNEVRGHYLQR
jgi:hypothetical protein